MAKIEAQVKEIMAKGKVPGATVGIVKDDELVHARTPLAGLDELYAFLRYQTDLAPDRADEENEETVRSDQGGN